MQVFVDYIGELNWLAILVASVASFVVSSIWYAESLFGKRWKKEVGLTDKMVKDSDMTNIMAVSGIAIVVTAVAMGLLVKVLVLETVYHGALFGVMVAVGLLGTNKLMQVKFEQRSMAYWYIVLGADIVSLAVMGAILAVW